MQNQNERKIPEILRGKTFLDPRYDPAFRAFFNDAKALTAFLNGILHLEGERRIESLEFSFADPIDFRTPEKQTVIFDIRATTADGRFLDIEMQRAKHPFFFDRMQTYGAFLTIRGKQEFTRSPAYQKLSPLKQKAMRYRLPELISIWICNFPVLEGSEFRDEWATYSQNAIHRQHRDILPVMDKLKYIVVDLTKFAKSPDELKTQEDIWLYLLSKLGEVAETPDFDDRIVSEAIERVRMNAVKDVLIEEQTKSMMDQDEMDCRIAESELKGFAEGESKGRAEGLAEGESKGHAEGLTEGISKGKLEMAKALLGQGVPVATIAQCSGLSETEIRRLN